MVEAVLEEECFDKLQSLTLICSAMKMRSVLDAIVVPSNDSRWGFTVVKFSKKIAFFK